MGNTIKREYPLSDANLFIKAEYIGTNMQTDAAEFAAKGVDAAEIAEFLALCDTFISLSDDPYYSYQTSIQIKEKDELRKKLEYKISEIYRLAKFKWGRNAPEISRFEGTTMLHEDDKKFLTTASHFHEVAEDYLAELAEYGLTQAKLDALAADINDFETMLNEIAETKSIRLKATEERIAKGNELFAKLQKYSALGKIIWQNGSRAKYDSYKIYKNRGKKKKKADEQ